MSAKLTPSEVSQMAHGEGTALFLKERAKNERLQAEVERYKSLMLEEMEAATKHAMEASEAELRAEKAEACLSEINALPDEWLAGDYSGDGKIHFRIISQAAVQLREILKKYETKSPVRRALDRAAEDGLIHGGTGAKPPRGGLKLGGQDETN